MYPSGPVEITFKDSTLVLLEVFAPCVIVMVVVGIRMVITRKTRT